jgi:sulfur transfer complex TusBCD TusB component (DsrH family)
MVAVALWVVPASAQSPASNAAADMWTRYAQCAREFVASAARQDPTLTFDQREAAIRPACGHFVEGIRDLYARSGLTRNDANRVIGAAYRSLSVDLRAIHAEITNQTIQARAEAARQAEAQERNRRREADADRERQNLITAAADAHRRCISDAVVDLMAATTEGAEAIATAAVTRCQNHEALRVQIGIAAYRVERDLAARVIAEDVARMKAQALSAVVEIRAAAARQRQSAPPAPSGTGGGVVERGT